MNILSIETSCDETAVSLVHAKGEFPHATYEILGNGLWSQVDAHAPYGGVYPTVAKREHARTLVPILKEALADEGLRASEVGGLDAVQTAHLTDLLAREPDLATALIEFMSEYQLPDIDLIAVTSGPGLEPALWVGVNFAKALAYLNNTPVIPVNHMEGHILASIYDLDRDDALAEINFPTIALLVSGGHTELILMSDWGTYEKIGQTRDDAVGEAFDKVARLLDLPYPGGPAIGKLAATARQQNLPAFADLPRPMLHSGDLDFSFSGLKTAVRYAINEQTLTTKEQAALARDFEDAAVEVLIQKSIVAVQQVSARTLIVGGGVANNQRLQQQLQSQCLTEFPDLPVYFPQPSLSTDNSIMIALAGHARVQSALSPSGAAALKANGRRSL